MCNEFLSFHRQPIAKAMQRVITHFPVTSLCSGKKCATCIDSSPGSDAAPGHPFLQSADVRKKRQYPRPAVGVLADVRSVRTSTFRGADYPTDPSPPSTRIVFPVIQWVFASQSTPIHLATSSVIVSRP